MKTNVIPTLISEDEVKNAMGRILSDTVMIDNRDIIVSVGHSICTMLGYSEKQFTGTPLSNLTGNSFPKQLPGKLLNGFFDQDQIEVYNIEGVSVSCRVSGFNLGLISEMNDFIILRFWNTLEEESVRRQLSERHAEMDEFINTTSHQMRGFLASIKGLINLLKNHSRIDEEHKFITSQVSHSAEQLDSRLHKIISFAEDNKIEECLKGGMPLTGGFATGRKVNKNQNQ